MTGSQDGPDRPSIEIADRDLNSMLRDQHGELCDAALHAIAGEIAVYGTLPAEALAGDITDTIARNIELFATTLVTGELPGESELDDIRLSAARRAEERIPLEVMLQAYPIAARVVFDRVTEHPGPGDAEAIRAMHTLVLRFLTTVMAAATSGYLDEHLMIADHAQTARDRLLDHLLAGRVAPTTALRELNLPDEVVVLAMTIGDHPDERQSGIDAPIAGRRKLRRLHAALRQVGGDQQLSSLNPSGGIAVVAADVAAIAPLVAALAAAAGVPVLAGFASARHDTVHDAATIARDVLEIATFLERPSGAYRLDDMLLEYQLSRPGPARDRLAERLAPLEADPAVLATLRRFVLHGQNRRRTALDLGIHPNTVDYRIAKVTRLTDLDPTAPEDAAWLRAALIARDSIPRDRGNGPDRNGIDAST